MFSDASQLKKSAQMLKALGNPYRLQIVALLTQGEQHVSAINQEVKVSQPALSQHLGKLRREGIVGARREQRQIFYYISNPHVLRLLGIAAEMASVSSEAKKKSA